MRAPFGRGASFVLTHCGKYWEQWGQLCYEKGLDPDGSSMDVYCDFLASMQSYFEEGGHLASEKLTQNDDNEYLATKALSLQPNARGA